MTPEERDKQRDEARGQYGVLRLVAIIASVFSLTVFSLLLINHLRMIYSDPVNSEVVTELIHAYNQDPGDADKQAQVRAMDLLARKALFNGLQFSRTGAYLLVFGIGVWILALKRMISLRAQLPDPRQYRDIDSYLGQQALTRWTVSLFGVFLVASVFALSATFRSEVPVPEAELDPGQAPVVSVETPAWEEVVANWPGFRGPNGSGKAYSGTPPSEWDGESKKNIKWTAQTPKPGFSSPVIWNDRLFLTGGDAQSREVYCYHADTGELAWQKTVPKLLGPEVDLPGVDDQTGYAPITPATDGKRIFALFNSAELVAFDFEGAFMWGRNLGLPDNPMGHSASLLVYQDLLYLQIDESEGGALIALNTTTGKEVWKTPRKVDSSWSTPIWAETDGVPRVFLNGAPFISAIHARSGELLWSIECMEGEVCPSPTFGGGKALFTTEYAKMHAVDIMTGKEVWAVEGDFPDVSSPAATDSCVFYGNNSGLVTCLNIENGETFWTHEFDEGFYASPVIVGDRVYLTDLDGVTHIFKAEPNFSHLSDQALGEPVATTPAFVKNRIYMRGHKNIVCIEEAP